ncbi:ABC transporter ATP-binding protein [Vibrio gazogenes]|uniref:Peptide/nickel transport system ATP-binding protein n=1 Tax=Vibrio gazogenes DSM 21264 = NBRC 103151 TaxID=1123492 RepID=A0A1M5FY59_VIBGA|nr:ATP-binding cassette domain-containing protein [Vibrio gazogenes]USP14698.1 ATP-binding cassette domain-containing protein [Vibrio gazogenes]SHF96465.1 peptide/nickel transport system ATP-binding protein [Vibrio gazogenes DSM 21264] [Vibrio gazogenes DSM 21264 = NBRC 103151]SJN52932.1 Glutathione import ATP-binding protein GsiA [Vibrio gazogenes]
MTPLLEVRQLSVWLGEHCVVGPVSLALAHGESLTILGETGAGKSLLLKAIIGALPASFTSRGEIWWSGQALHTMSAHERENLWGRVFSILPQEPSLALDPLMPLSRQAEEVPALLRNHDAQASRAQTSRLFDSVGLRGHEPKYPVQLSGGMAQRGAYVCAVSGGGEILIADEPTKGLDDHNRERLVTMLEQYRQQGALLTVTHDIEVAEQLGGTIIVIQQGDVVEQGKANAVLAEPQHAYTRQLINAHPRHWAMLNDHQPGEVLLRVHQLTMAVENRVLFENLSFELRAGEVLGIRGPSGCGKSTLCQAILGLRAPLAGEIEYLQPLGVGQKLKLYQDPPSAFASHVSLGTLVDDICRRYQIADDVPQALMKRLHLDPKLLRQSASQVSGGELQRFAILRVLLLKPKLLIADEPTTRLDPSTAQETLALILEAAREIDCALLLVSHEHNVLNKVCHRVIELSSDVPVSGQEPAVADQPLTAAD